MSPGVDVMEAGIFMGKMIYRPGSHVCAIQSSGDMNLESGRHQLNKLNLMNQHQNVIDIWKVQNLAHVEPSPDKSDQNIDALFLKFFLGCS